MSNKLVGVGNLPMWYLKLRPVRAAAVFNLRVQSLAEQFRREYIPAVGKGVHDAAEAGVLAGYPVTDVKVRLYDGSFHEVDSNEMAFRTAGSMAFREGTQKAGPILQEPVMKVEVVVPDEFLGDVIGQLNSRRGEILGMEIRPGKLRQSERWYR